jgi:hypothetical protein
MELGPELMPPPISPSRRDEIGRRIHEIEHQLSMGRNANGLINKFNVLAGRHYDEHTFRHYWRAISFDDFVNQSSRPTPQQIKDVTREELVEVVRRMMNGENADSRFYMEIFAANIRFSRASNLMFSPLDYEEETDTWVGGRPIGEYDPTPEEIVNQALARTDS